MASKLYVTRRRWLAAAIGGLVLVIVGGPLVWLERQGVTLKYASSIVLARLHLVSVAEPEMVTVPGGSYQQGDIRGLGSNDEQPVRQVTIKPFPLGKYEVTFEEYDRYVELIGGRSPSDQSWGRGKRPVINVSWDDAMAYAKWLSQATGNRYRLPTESEWEYAARSGGNDETWAGTSDEKQLADYVVYGQRGTESVGSKKPNGLGLFDMSGNVEEWVDDCWHNSYQGAPTDGSAWLEENGGECGRRVIRGGSWLNEPGYLRVSFRFRGGTDDRFDFLGFRLVQDPNS
jgi:formylglycine-generating enzyme required for sulfatase activity